MESTTVAGTSVRGVTLHRLSVSEDPRGKLAAGEFERDIPFVARRYFIVFDVPGRVVRGQHAHRQCDQFLICLRGSVTVVVDDGVASEAITLSDSSTGLFVPAMTWADQRDYSADAILLVFASEHYDASDYIRDYDAFKTAANRRH